ncbi:MAG TPA: glycosyltransferase [Methanobacteriaceae archaeon]|nr:glycosyltransferase [Methanobacteriaceae archaeon]
MKNNHPTVSVVLPTYNRATVVGDAIKSVLDQTFCDLELIVVDDGSTDNTLEVVNSFKDDRVQYVTHSTNKGAASAMNTGIRASRGDYVSIQNSDDYWLPDKIENEIKAFEGSDSTLGVVYSGVCQIKNDKQTYIPGPGVKKKEGYIHGEILGGNFVNGLSLMKKECFQKAGFYDENLPGLEDWELYIRISKYYQFKFVDKPLIRATISHDSLSGKASVFIDSAKIIVEKNYDDYHKNKKALSSIYGSSGSWSCLDGQLKIGRSFFTKSIKINPTNLQVYIALFLSLFGQRVYRAFYKALVDTV